MAYSHQQSPAFWQCWVRAARKVCSIALPHMQLHALMAVHYPVSVVTGPAYYKSVEAMLYTVAASEGRTTGLPVG